MNLSVTVTGHASYPVPDHRVQHRRDRSPAMVTSTGHTTGQTTGQSDPRSTPRQREHSTEALPTTMLLRFCLPALRCAVR